MPRANGVQVIFASLTGDIMLDALIGAVFAIISYSSLAAVLLTATLTGTGVIFPVALCLVIGANLGSGLLAMLNNSGRQRGGAAGGALAAWLFKLVGSLIILPFVHVLADVSTNCRWKSRSWLSTPRFYNLIRCVAMVPFAGPMANLCKRLDPR